MSANGSAYFAAGFGAQLANWARAAGASPDDAMRLARVGSRLAEALAQGHVCIPLRALCARDEDDAALRTALIATSLVSTHGTPGMAPLVLEGERLYLRRYADFEARLARRVQHFARAAQPPGPAARALLRTLFRKTDDGEPDWQQLAAALALVQRLTIVSGGPGTGKTTTVANLIACLLMDDPGLKIVLAAPTGKAAARLLDALRVRAGHLPEPVRDALPQDAATIHRLLGASARGFIHDAGNPISLDVLIVDEASMLDLVLATHLFEALLDNARVILLGDCDQLAAVEAGAVFAELSADARWSDALCAQLSALTGTALARATLPAPRTPTALADQVAWLQRSYRFAPDSGIGRLAAAVRGGDLAVSRSLVEGGARDLRWLDDGSEALSAATREQLCAAYAGYAQAVRSGAHPEAVFAAFERVRVLCAQREGARGVAALDALLAREFCRMTGQLRASNGVPEWYAGRPVIIRKNDAALNLFNGDIGLVLRDETGQLRVYFADAQGLRAISPLRLPAFDSAFALTVHKSQGSEFDAVFVVLPQRPGPLVSRELLYTAITRAKAELTLIGPQAVLEQAISTPGARFGGLALRLAHPHEKHPAQP